MDKESEQSANNNTLPIPQEMSEGVRKRMKNLLQYSGKKRRTKENGEEFLTDKPVPLSVVQAEILPGKTIDVPVVTTNDQQALATTIPITTQAVLRKDEFKVFVTEVSEWLASHPDWTLKEDLDDIYGIAMEKVIQYRLLLDKRVHPRSDIEKDYHTSNIRMQAFRQNLAARRADRISGKGSKVINQTNIAIIASQMDAGKLQDMKRKIDRFNQEEDERFGVLEVKEIDNGSTDSDMVSSNRG